MHRFAALLLCAVVAAGSLLAAPAPFPRAPGRPRPCLITCAAFERIKGLTTRPQIEAGLGVPPGDYRTGPVELNMEDTNFSVSSILTWTQESWDGDEGTIWVRVHEDGTVREMGFIRAVRKAR